MNQEKLKFIPGDTIQVMPGDGVESGGFESQIHVVGEEVWLCRIHVHGYRQDDTEALRNRILWALNQPTEPAQWQYLEAYKDYDGEVTGHYWRNLDNGGEAATKKGQGYEVRSLYAKPTPQEVTP